MLSSRVLFEFKWLHDDMSRGALAIRQYLYHNTKYSVVSSLLLLTAYTSWRIARIKSIERNTLHDIRRYLDTGSARARIRCLPKVLPLPERLKKWLGRHKADNITRLAGNNHGERFVRHGHACGSILTPVPPSELAKDWLD